MNELILDTHAHSASNGGRSKSLSGTNLVRFKKIIDVGIKNIFSHGLRSMLTVLGIVIGVAAVIAMLAVSEGASYEAQQQFRDLGASNILLKSVKPAEVEESTSRGFGPPQAVVYGLTNADITTIRDTIPSVSNVIASRIVISASIVKFFIDYKTVFLIL